MIYDLLLGLDCSSTAIGWCLLAGDPVAHGEIYLKHIDVNVRCRLAREQLEDLLTRWQQIEAAAIESPASVYSKGLIPQCFVAGAVRSLLSERGLLICDVAPAAAKKALTGMGNADKQLMRTFAEAKGVYGEHAADAYGVVLAASQRIEVTR